jgi:dihydroxyacid dehydratase/phosphogluconate dehydratase
VPVIPASWEVKEEDEVWNSLHKCEALTQEFNQSKRAGGIVQVVEHLPSKHKALNSNCSTITTIKKMLWLQKSKCSLELNIFNS